MRGSSLAAAAEADDKARVFPDKKPCCDDSAMAAAKAMRPASERKEDADKKEEDDDYDDEEVEGTGEASENGELGGGGVGSGIMVEPHRRHALPPAEQVR